ncbi:MAG: hypothetical protein ACREO0_04495, partial [Pseudoxanthomonas sp.]
MKSRPSGRLFCVATLDVSHKTKNKERHPGERRDPSSPAAIRTQEHLLTDSWIPAFAGMTAFEYFSAIRAFFGSNPHNYNAPPWTSSKSSPWKPRTGFPMFL